MGFVLVTRVGMSTRDGRTLAVLSQGFLNAVVASNRVAMRAARLRGRPFPLLYESGVEYDREPWAGRFEEFADAVTVLERGWGDCDDLASFRVAELQEQGEPATVRVYWRRNKRTGSLMMHIQVRRGVCAFDGARLNVINGRPSCPICKRLDSGRIEDPSRFLGL